MFHLFDLAPLKDFETKSFLAYTRPMLKKLLPYGIMTLLVVLLLVFSPFEVKGSADGNETVNVNGEISKLVNSDGLIQTFEVLLEDGRSIEVVNDETLSASPRQFEPGDKVLLSRFQEDDGRYGYYIADYLRNGALIWLFALFVVVVLVVTKWQGLGSLVGMAMSFVVLFKVILPLILGGFDPVWAAIIGSILIIPATFYFSHGFNRKTSVAVVSTFITLLVTGFLAKVFADLGNLTGLSSEEVSYLKLETKDLVDFKGLVLAGMIIGVMGILDDITISQSSVVRQLKSVKDKIKFRELFSRSMTVGRDHIASMVNTLVLVYTGASIPLLLLFLDHSQRFGDVINLEFVAVEVIQTLVGSIGLILAVPISTLLACLAVGKAKQGEKEEVHCHH